MKTVEDFMAAIEPAEHREKFESVFDWALEKYPELTIELKWNQPNLLRNGKFIMSGWTAGAHFALAPEVAVLAAYRDEIHARKYTTSKKILRIKWGQDIDFDLLARMLETTIDFKCDCASFWAPREWSLDENFHRVDSRDETGPANQEAQ